MSSLPFLAFWFELSTKTKTKTKTKYCNITKLALDIHKCGQTIGLELFFKQKGNVLLSSYYGIIQWRSWWAKLGCKSVQDWSEF